MRKKILHESETEVEFRVAGMDIYMHADEKMNSQIMLLVHKMEKHNVLARLLSLQTALHPSLGFGPLRPSRGTSGTNSKQPRIGVTNFVLH